MFEFHVSRIISIAFSFKYKRDRHNLTERFGLDGKFDLQNRCPIMTFVGAVTVIWFLCFPNFTLTNFEIVPAVMQWPLFSSSFTIPFLRLLF